jgi:hypothetical protein
MPTAAWLINWGCLIVSANEEQFLMLTLAGCARGLYELIQNKSNLLFAMFILSEYLNTLTTGAYERNFNAFSEGCIS